MSMRRILPLTFVLAACQDDAELSSRPARELVPGVVDVQIGEFDGPGAYVFGRVTGLAEDHRGRIHVADLSANEVRVFSSAGAFLFSIGREGEGPGELRGPCCITMIEDTLWIRDGGNRRYVGYRVLDDSAVAMRTVRMAHSDGWNSAPLGVSPEGGLIDTGYRFSPTGTSELTRFYLSADGEVSTTVAIEEPTPEQLGTVVKQDQMSRFFFPQPFGPRFLVAYGPNGMYATAVSSSFEVTAHNADTVTWTIVGETGEGPVLTAAEQTRAEQRISDYVQRGGGTRSDYPRVPARKTPLADLMFDQEARLWIVFNVPEGEPGRAQVYGPDGQLMGERTWPSDVDLGFPAWIEEDHALGISVDSLGVQRVIRLRFGT